MRFTRTMLGGWRKFSRWSSIYGNCTTRNFWLCRRHCPTCCANDCGTRWANTRLLLRRMNCIKHFVATNSCCVIGISHPMKIWIGLPQWRQVENRSWFAAIRLRALKVKLQGQADIELLHGRFNGRDRLRKEEIVRSATGSRSEQRKAIVLVATQVVEVSLDIDLDVIYTDPAPLEALLQRFGRINRRRLNQDGARVHVFREPIPEKPRPYEPDLIRAALDVLEKHDREWIDEARVSDWLDEIYARPEIRAPWLETFQSEYAEFTASAVNTLRAFQSDSRLEELFYKAF